MKKIKKPISILLSVLMVLSVFAIVPLSASAAYWYSDLARGTLIQPEDTFSFEEIGSFKFADYNDPTIIHEVKGSDFSYNQATLSVTDGYYSFGSTKLLPTSVSPGGLLIADYDSTTKMATFGVQNITHSFDETTGTLTIGGTGVVPPNYAFTGSDVYGVVFTQSNLVKHLIIDATDMIAIKQDAFMAYTGGCVLEDVEINSTSSTPLIIERNAVFYESDNTVTITVNAVKLATVTNSPVDNYSSPVNLIYNVKQPITFKKNALTEPWSDFTVTFPTGCKIFIPGGPQFTDSRLQEEYDREAEYGYEEFFWRRYPNLVEGTDYVLGDARYEELTPLNASLVVGNNNTALFSASTGYTVTWKNWNDDELYVDPTVPFGETPTYPYENPTRPEDDDNTYTFSNWDPDVQPVTGDVTYTAQFTAAPYVASVTSNGTTTKYTAFGTAVSNWTDGSTLTLLANVTTSSVIYFESGVKTLDLNGYGIKNTSANYQNSNSVIYIRGSGTQLTLQDSRPNETTHYFTAPAGNAGLATDISDIDSGDQQSFHGGYLTGGNCFSGGGIRVDNGANLIMTGGTIIGNRGIYGGGIDVEKNGSAGGSATISGGAIMYNYGTNYNGAIHTNGANYVSVSNCKITNNYAEHGAGGAYKSSINGGFSGNLIIKDNKTGNTECNVLIESNQYISLTSALGENASIGITMNNPGVFTNSSTTDYNVASKFKSDNSSYAVGKNADGQLYLSKKLIAGHTLSLDGNIAINFYLDPSAAGLTANQVTADNFSYSFAWADVDKLDGKPLVSVSDQAKSKAFRVSNDGKYIIVTCHVCAAEMSCGVNASFTLGEKTESEVYSVRQYGDEVFNATDEEIDERFGGAEEYGKLTDLMTKMLDYGAKAQTVFGIKTGDPANTGLDYTMSSDTPDFDEAIQTANGSTADDLAELFGKNFKAPSLVFLDYSTLKLYFENKDGSLSTSGLTKWNNYYYIKQENIAASQLDTLQTFTVSGKTFRYSALDYAKVLAASENADNANLAKALYWYNQAANAYFG